MSTTSIRPADLAIPSAYLEDVRSAIIFEIDDEGCQLRTNQDALVEDDGDVLRDMHRGDRDSALDLLRDRVRLLDQLIGATAEDTTVTAPPEAPFHVLESMCRTVAKRLEDPLQYGPPPMGKVAELADRLGWAARQAIELFPSEA